MIFLSEAFPVTFVSPGKGAVMSFSVLGHQANIGGDSRLHENSQVLRPLYPDIDLFVLCPMPLSKTS
jgi:hypothetical protein